jgi:uncharacterized delta-60 repeat protein
MLLFTLLSACGSGNPATSTGGGSTPLASGVLDPTFNSRGYVVVNSGFTEARTDHAFAMTLDTEGRVLVAGASSNTISYDMLIWRFTPSGSLDYSFGSTGYVRHSNAANGSSLSDDFGRAISVDRNGNILVAGSSQDSTGTDNMVVWRYNALGGLDTSFNHQGFLVHGGASLGFGHEHGYGITSDSQGNVLVTGDSATTPTGIRMAIWRYTQAGVLDTTFGSGGFVTHGIQDGAAGKTSGRAITIDTAGRILVAGEAYNGVDWDMVVWRYTPDGLLDASFNGTGYVVHDNAGGGQGNDLGRGIAVDSHGRVLVTGNSYHRVNAIVTNIDMVIWRYTTNGQLDTSFNGRGYVTFDNPAGADDFGNRITIDPSGNILVAGESFGEMAIWRYTDTGVLDTTFNGRGYVFHYGRPVEVVVVREIGHMQWPSIPKEKYTQREKARARGVTLTLSSGVTVN